MRPRIICRMETSIDGRLRARRCTPPPGEGGRQVPLPSNVHPRQDDRQRGHLRSSRIGQRARRERGVIEPTPSRSTPVAQTSRCHSMGHGGLLFPVAEQRRRSCTSSHLPMECPL